MMSAMIDDVVAMAQQAAIDSRGSRVREETRRRGQERRVEKHRFVWYHIVPYMETREEREACQES